MFHLLKLRLCDVVECSRPPRWLMSTAEGNIASGLRHRGLASDTPTAVRCDPNLNITQSREHLLSDGGNWLASLRASNTTEGCWPVVRPGTREGLRSKFEEARGQQVCKSTATCSLRDFRVFPLAGPRDAKADRDMGRWADRCTIWQQQA